MVNYFARGTVANIDFAHAGISGDVVLSAGFAILHGFFVIVSIVIPIGILFHRRVHYDIRPRYIHRRRNNAYVGLAILGILYWSGAAFYPAHYFKEPRLCYLTMSEQARTLCLADLNPTPLQLEPID